MATQPAGDIAFVGPAHLSYLSDYQYVEVVSVEEASVHVSIAGPDATSGGSMYTMPLGTFQHRVVPARERDLWPGSYLAHPVAFVWTTDDGVDVWSYGVVSGCSATDDETTLHIVGHEGPVRLPLVATTAIIKADVLTILFRLCVLQPFNLCASGENKSWHSTATRARRPEDLYSDPAIGRLPDQASATISRQTTGDISASDSDSDNISNSPGDNDDEDIQAIRHAHRPNPKRRRIELASDSDSSQDQDYRGRSRQRGLVFQPSPIDRQVHDAVVHRRHTGKAPQTLLQSVQQSDQLDFIGTPPVLRAAYHFGFGVGLSIMHFRRASPSDDVMSTENGVDMWDFSAKNSIRPPPKANTFNDLISALAAFYKFGKVSTIKRRRSSSARRETLLSPMQITLPMIPGWLAFSPTGLTPSSAYFAVG
ncbi:hypothetical protein PF002_g27000 [Phytophthora fragariae]|uniref:Uncharacterized protein n=1 Tax=Phytophthora fragariae TaxID=53985 RepID=A0A6A3HXK6_9STRA|nr:hypothetical protein PF003_g32873 [Phytophthora fragariae]KAE8972683.1 hypothetical protein PF011_g25548 [Phytophthora fragariae]KAE9084952.1 hypothetical protein PF006_g26361 [Phytophthora fragariae]KAE9088005.1 hypothetical protein PF007_g20145 [Phytophthora fragariae]KAE9182387.1 hypothetical protein PF002_g27000 [Phytophthora fragariae]